VADVFGDGQNHMKALQRKKEEGSRKKEEGK
jgi:hypothetical protein